MNPFEFEQRASAIYGNDWQSPFARKIRVDARTVRRWKSGDRNIPEWVDWAIGILERHEAER